jgi:hypothetical protein
MVLVVSERGAVARVAKHLGMPSERLKRVTIFPDRLPISIY